MSRGVVDTSVFIARETGRPFNATALPDHVTVSAVTVAELRVGVLTAPDVRTRSQRLATFGVASALGSLPIDDAVAAVWAELRVLLRETGSRSPVNDTWIAATALAHDIPVVTQDDDYAALSSVSGLQVIRV